MDGPDIDSMHCYNEAGTHIEHQIQFCHEDKAY